jgi:hypothetical protein
MQVGTDVLQVSYFWAVVGRVSGPAAPRVLETQVGPFLHYYNERLSLAVHGVDERDIMGSDYQGRLPVAVVADGAAACVVAIFGRSRHEHAYFLRVQTTRPVGAPDTREVPVDMPRDVLRDMAGTPDHGATLFVCGEWLLCSQVWVAPPSRTQIDARVFGFRVADVLAVRANTEPLVPVWFAGRVLQAGPDGRNAPEPLTHVAASCEI